MCFVLGPITADTCLRAHRLRGILVAHSPGRSTTSPKPSVGQPQGAKSRLHWAGTGSSGLVPQSSLIPQLASSDVVGRNLKEVLSKEWWWGGWRLQPPLPIQLISSPCSLKLSSPGYRGKGNSMVYMERGKQIKYCIRAHFISNPLYMSDVFLEFDH